MRELALPGTIAPQSDCGMVDLTSVSPGWPRATVYCSDSMNRREFLTTAAAAPMVQSAAPPKMVGIQVGAVSFVDEGVDTVLDIFQQRAFVNTLFLAVFTYGRGIAGRQVPGQPLPDHGRQEYDLSFHGGNYARPHAQYYRDTVLKETRAPDHGDLDIIEAVLPAVRQRGMKLVCWLEDVWRSDVPNIEKLQEVDLYGRRRSTLCFNNPDHRAFLTALVEDYTRSYDIDGIMWGSERHGALGNALGASHGGRGADSGRVGCFCPFCEAKAKQQGIRFDRVKEGYKALESFVRAGRRGARPVDGYFVEFLRIAMRYPEILAWEQFFHDALRENYAAMYQTVKAAKPEVQVGWHIWHNNSFSPFYRAQQDLRELSKYSDFLKMVMYHNCGGERMAAYIDSVSQNVFGDLSKEDLTACEYRLMNYRERGYEQIPFTGLSADYVYRETKRAMEGVTGTKTLIWPGIDIDIPTGASQSKSTPKGTRDAVVAALQAGAHGVLLSRKYSEMSLANLSGAGEALRELGLV